ncbi:hypothetical protein DFO73_107178 [Cytobacillus oceanisediminis]|jgi:hypothetical protein|uniref:Uncharacterized protein n=1 Tax=Cytobacillus oceanisediminis TaxID=665099 RepID=A0A2V2ZWY9_9BACI|nr:hypothetical protein DFO73_107178 [Cytobacillus oceanisediminis]
MEEAFAKGLLNQEIFKLGLFTDLKFRQWIDIFLVPNTFIFLYIGIRSLYLWIYDRTSAAARKIRVKHGRYLTEKKKDV